MIPSKAILTTPDFSEKTPPKDANIRGVAILNVEAIRPIINILVSLLIL